jgi:hypothetical protein
MVDIDLHPAAEKAMEDLHSDDPERFGIVMDWIEDASQAIPQGKRPVKEDSAGGQLTKNGIRKLKIKSKGSSIRVYFTAKNDCLKVVGVDANKRRTKMTKGMVDALISRL